MANKPTNVEHEDDLTLKVDSILEQLSLLIVQPPSPQQHVSPSPSNVPKGFRRPHMKLEVPKFDENEFIDWILKIFQFFYYHNTPEPKRFQVSFFLYGRTSSQLVPVDVPE
ncbi:hypothetical protein V8G54_032095 [Vigna mungo]|uniref:Uncharacterized protein n=1 Tax=Vigna mungo TaxID=3915 RepID=A0AAQ3MKY3_VIGMU